MYDRIHYKRYQRAIYGKNCFMNENMNYFEKKNWNGRKETKNTYQSIFFRVNQVIKVSTDNFSAGLVNFRRITKI